VIGLYVLIAIVLVLKNPRSFQRHSPVSPELVT